MAVKRMVLSAPVKFRIGQKVALPDIGPLKGDVVTIDSTLQPADRQNPDGWYWVKFTRGGGRVKMKSTDLRLVKASLNSLFKGKKTVRAKEEPGDDNSAKRIKSLEDQIKQASEQLKLARETDSKSDRVFNLQQRINTLKTQKDRLKKRTDDKKERESKDGKDETASRGNWNPDVIKPKPRCRLCNRVVADKDMVRLNGINPAHKSCADKKNLPYTEGPAIHKKPNLSASQSGSACKLHGKVDCKSTMCPESPNFNILTTI